VLQDRSQARLSSSASISQMAEPAIHLVPLWPAARVSVSREPQCRACRAPRLPLRSGMHLRGTDHGHRRAGAVDPRSVPNDASPLKLGRWSGLAAPPNDPAVRDS
jgi:hypothetical protein